MNKNSPGLFLIITLMLFSCNKSLPVLTGIDLNLWHEDKNACNGDRTNMMDATKKEADKILGLSENELVELLGRPDHNELYKRNQKFYYYFLEPSDKCGANAMDTPSKLVIRFNAMGIAKEVSVEQ